jgi:hypothetical protein
MSTESSSSTSTYNIQPVGGEALSWDPDSVGSSLKKVADYAETMAANAISWYWSRKIWKARLSQAIQMTALASTALAGLFPVVVSIVPVLRSNLGTISGLAASVFVGFAAALIGLDKAFGLSSGWARYVLTATTIRKSLEEFRMEWTALLAKANTPPTKDDIAALLQRARDFVGVVEGMVLQETKDWVTEFQNNVAQLEKETKAQLDSIKTDADKTQAARMAESKVGSVEITVSNADKTDNHTFEVLWEGAHGQSARETVTDGEEWIRINVPPGQYSATVSGAIGGKPSSKKSVVILGPGESKKVDITLPTGVPAPAPNS